mmetsp:Transcript_1583/g.4511  ORF Transcript_1583/g.4511 Transcript_1583/m.4511 type:complete len:463 (-) Transcript_1583:40-1428(-)
MPGAEEPEPSRDRSRSPRREAGQSDEAEPRAAAAEEEGDASDVDVDDDDGADDGDEEGEEEEGDGMDDGEASSLLEQAAECLAELPPRVDRARELFEEAWKAEPDSPEVLDAFGAFLCEDGDVERARQLLLRSAELRPKEGAEKFLYLAQMSSGEEALSHFSRGAGVLQTDLDRLVEQASRASSSTSLAGALGSGEGGASEGSEIIATVMSRAAAPLRRQLAGVRASIAELYMTDLCDLSEAEEKCEQALELGLKADPTCLELLVAKATFRKVQGRVDEAKQLTLEAARIIKAAGGRGVESDSESEAESEAQADAGDEAKADAGSEAKGDAGDAALEKGASEAEEGEEGEEGEEPELPDEDIVASVCRTMIDLEQTAEARRLLCGLLQRDEEDLRAWVLLGWCHVVEKEPDTAEDCAKHGMKLCKKHGAIADAFKPELKKLLEKARGMERVAKPQDGDDEEG